jgi:hypothetical protein
VSKERRRIGTKIIAEERALGAVARLYGEHGFDVRLPAGLAERAGGREGLRERALARLFAGRWQSRWDALLVDRRVPLARRLTRFFTEYRSKIERSEARLWTRAGLLGMHGPAFSRTLEKRILVPVARELRHAARVKSKRPVSKREIELVQVLHGAIAFPHTRSYIFDMDVFGRLPALVAMMVRVWLPGAMAETRRINKPTRP